MHPPHILFILTFKTTLREFSMSQTKCPDMDPYSHKFHGSRNESLRFWLPDLGPQNYPFCRKYGRVFAFFPFPWASNEKILHDICLCLQIPYFRYCFTCENDTIPRGKYYAILKMEQKIFNRIHFWV